MLLHARPRPGSLDTWLARFREAHPEAGHVTPGVDTPHVDQDAPREFGEAGLLLVLGSVLTARSTAPTRPVPTGVPLRPLTSGEDWAQALDLRLAVNAAEARPLEEEGHREFAARELAALRAAGARPRLRRL